MTENADVAEKHTAQTAKRRNTVPPVSPLSERNRKTNVSADGGHVRSKQKHRGELTMGKPYDQCPDDPSEVCRFRFWGKCYRETERITKGRKQKLKPPCIYVSSTTQRKDDAK